MAKKRRVNLATVLILLLFAFVILQSGIINYWQPTPVYVMVDGGGGGTSKHIADTWQKWNIKLNSATGPTSSYESATRYIYLPYQLGPSTSGRPYYVEVEIPIKYLGGLPTYGTIGTSGYWYARTEILGVANVYLNDLGHFVGKTNLASTAFSAHDATGTVRSVKFVIGTHAGITYYTGKYGIPSQSKPIDIESYLAGLELQGITEFTLIVHVTEVWILYKVQPFLPGPGYGEAWTKVDEVSVTFPGSVSFSLPQTWTGTYASTATWQTQTVGYTGTKTVTCTIVVPSTRISVAPTTIGSVTFTGYYTEYQGTTIVRTATMEYPPFEIPDFLKWLFNGIASFFKGFGIDLSDWQLWLALIGLVLLVILLLYLLLRRRDGGGGQVVVLRA